MALRMNKRLQREYESFQKNAHDMVVSLPEENLTLWHVKFTGAKGTLYEGENFTVQFRFNNDYVRYPAFSQSSHRKSCSLAMYLCTSTSTPTDLYVYQFYTMVRLFRLRVVSCLDSYFYLFVSVVYDEQCQKKDQAFQ